MIRFVFIVVYGLMLLGVKPKAYAQGFEDDARLWLHMKVDKNVLNKLNIHLSIQNRIDENMTRYTRTVSELGLTYKLIKHLRLVADYSFGFDRRWDDSFERLHRLDAGFIVRKKIKNFSISSRNLVQWQYKNMLSSENGNLAKIYYRTKLTFHYQISKRYECYAAQEINLALQSSSEEGLSRSRTFTGLVYNLSKNTNIEVYFLFQRQFKLSNVPQRDFVYGIKFAHSL